MKYDFENTYDATTVGSVVSLDCKSIQTYILLKSNFIMFKQSNLIFKEESLLLLIELSSLIIIAK